MLFQRRVEDLGGGNHDAEIDHLVVVAAEDHTDDVLADVVDVTLDGGHDDTPLRLTASDWSGGAARCSSSMNGSRYATAFFIARALLTTCGRNIFPAPNRSPTIFMPSMSGPSMMSSGRAIFPARLFGILLDVLDGPVHERMREPLFDGPLAPGDVLFALLAGPLHGLGELNQALGRVRTPVEDDVLDVLEQILGNVLVDDQLTRVDDSHVHPGLDRVEQKGRVHRLADHVVAAEREREVADAAADLGAGTDGLDDPRRLDEVHGVVVVLFEAGGNRQDVGVEDDVGRIEARLLDQQPVGPLADLHFALDRVGLAGLVERHHDNRRAVSMDEPRPLEELRLPFLQADRVDDALTLHALEPGLEDRPLRAVDHHRHPGDLRLRRDVVEEGRHRLLGIEHAFVHVDVDDIGAAADLIERDVRRIRILAGFDEPGEARRAGHVGSLAHHLEIAVGTDHQRLEAGELGKTEVRGSRVEDRPVLGFRSRDLGPRSSDARLDALDCRRNRC